jgi:hypothetical protein
MENKNLFNLLFAKRYFHLIAFKSDKNYSIQNFWKDCGIKADNDSESFNNSNFTIELRKTVSNIRFYNSDEDFSVNKNGEAPYNYDILAIHLKEEDILVFGFPFKYLTKTIIDDLVLNKNLLKITKGSFLKADLNKLIKINQETAFSDETFSCYFSGIELNLPGDSNITSVNLDGDKPLDSILYKTVFKGLINKNECLIEKGSLRCETLANELNSIPKTGSNIHIDLFGNYKLYIHGTGKNIITIPFIFQLLNNYGCLETTLINPILRLKDE